MPIVTSVAVATARAYGFTSRMKKLVTVTITSSQTWVAPLNVAIVDVTGRGGDGAPGGSTTGPVSGYNTYMNDIYYYADGSTTDTGYQFQGWSQGSPPADYCQHYGPSGNPNAVSRQICFIHTAATGTGTVYYPARDGSASQALGKTFAGGIGTAAPAPASYTNVAVTPGASYPIIVGAANGGSTNGSVTISYWQ